MVRTKRTGEQFEKILLDSNGGVIGTADLGTRFKGTLLPGAGKPAFFGGSIESGDRRGDTPEESAKNAAIREFWQELCLKEEAFDWKTLNSLLEEVLYKEDWGGIYYSLNLDKVTTLKDTILSDESIAEINRSIKQFTESNTLEQVYNNKMHSLPEMRIIQWKNAEQLASYMESSDDEFTQGQISLYCSFLMRTLGIEDDSNDLHQAFCHHLVTHIKCNEKIDSNVETAKRIVGLLLPTRGREASSSSQRSSQDLAFFSSSVSSTGSEFSSSAAVAASAAVAYSSPQNRSFSSSNSNQRRK